MTERAPEPVAASGLRTLGRDEFSFAAAVGGWRGLIESVAPGLVFVVLFVITHEVRTPVVASLAVAALAVVARLVRRSPVTYALGGVVGVLIGAFWAWRSGEAQNYYAWGLVTNAAFAVACAVSLAARRPLVGLAVSALGLQRSVAARDAAAAPTGPDAVVPVPDGDPHAVGRETPPLLDTSWRRDAVLLRRYTWATWLWLAAFVLRLAVQLPLYLGGSVGWLGTARLVMGLPMWALVLWITWLLVRPRPRPSGAAGAREPDVPSR